MKYRLAYLTCPECHERINTPFTRGEQTLYVHVRPDRPSCGLLAVEPADIGDAHRVYRVSLGEHLERLERHPSAAVRRRPRLALVGAEPLGAA